MLGKVLLIAFDFPPCQSPGVERTLRFAQYLQTMGWQPHVLTVNTNTFGENTTFDDHCFPFPVYRTFCLDVSKHLAFRGKYIGGLKKPDRYVGWILTAVPKAVSIIKKQQIDIVWSTYPLLTSHIIGLIAAKVSNTPWIADYRDPLQCHYDASVYDSFGFHRWIEQKVITTCQKAIFATDGAKQMYERLYSCNGKFHTIENGIEPKLLHTISRSEYSSESKFVLLHLGSLYENGRDTKTLYKALGELKRQGIITVDNFELILVGSKTEGYQQVLIEEAGLNDLVTIKPQVNHKAALTLLANVDGLLVIQGDIFNAQIPSKAYEYLATPLPIIALTPEEGDTGKLLNGFSGCFVTNTSKGVENALNQLLSAKEKPAFIRNINKYTRHHAAAKLARVLENLMQETTSK